jgi:HD-GYP domain-containing protein (c-di-GMP phosphodiesterase class II)
MLSPRPYRPAMSVTECIDELQKQSGRRYDPRVVKACVKALRDGVVKAKLAAPIEQNAAADQQIA